MSNILILYDSKTGNTAKMAELVALLGQMVINVRFYVLMMLRRKIFVGVMALPRITD